VTALTWDQVGQRIYETGVDHGVLYKPDVSGDYTTGVAWNGLTSVNETPTGAESNKQYADNIVYVNLQSIEEFGCTIEAFTYPDEFMACDGTSTPEPGVYVGQQPRETFGFSYRTLIGNDLVQTQYGYKLHLVYGALASPSEKTNATVNDSPEAATFSWDVTTTPVEAPSPLKPTAKMTIDSTKVDAGALSDLEDLLYGTVGTDPSLPLPAAVIAIFEASLTEAVPTEPTFVGGTNTITIPTVTGVIYKIAGVVVAAGDVVITENTLVTAEPAAGYKFPVPTDDDWLYPFTP
jgi:hypothetical protein